jgi:hypothetical protein
MGHYSDLSGFSGMGTEMTIQSAGLQLIFLWVLDFSFKWQTTVGAKII